MVPAVPATSFVALVVVVSMAAASAVGCGGASASEKQMTQLRDEIHRVQSERDQMDQRVAALELQKDDKTKQTTLPHEASDAATAAETPRLRVVRLQPPGSPEESPPPASTARAPEKAESTEDRSPRPTIRVTGTPGRPHGRTAGDRIEQTEADDDGGGRAAAARPSALDPDAGRAYDSALALVRGKQFDKALEAFAGFLVRWPDHPNADNALYWRGECFFAQGDYARAAEQFEGTVARFPMGNKVPDALLKLGMSQRKLGAAAKARQSFEKLAREYPRSEAARRIPREETP